MKNLLLLGSIFGFLAVALGAFGSHSLESIWLKSPNSKDIFETAVKYQFYHVFAILACSILLKLFPTNTWLLYAGYTFTAGILLFSGSLYILSTTGIKMPWVFITPLGGLCYLVGWFILIWQSFKLVK
ncbi:MAG: DUF423 domain-containing protein [Bacteroidota bacterium]|nr:DUF423 domain-containing protein [Bacteroidota bacterium]